jgi:hypothetical protein
MFLGITPPDGRPSCRPMLPRTSQLGSKMVAGAQHTMALRKRRNRKGPANKKAAGTSKPRRRPVGKGHNKPPEDPPPKPTVPPISSWHIDDQIGAQIARALPACRCAARPISSRRSRWLAWLCNLEIAAILLPQQWSPKRSLRWRKAGERSATALCERALSELCPSGRSPAAASPA